MVKDSWKKKPFVEMIECIFRKKKNRLGIIRGVQGKPKEERIIEAKDINDI